MSRKLLRPALAALVLAPVAVAPAFAHTMVRSTSIADGATLAQSPPSISIAFEHPAAMGALRLETATGERIPLDWTPPRAISATFVVPLPRLEPDRYRLSWRVIAQDGHVMSGSLAFTVGAQRSTPASKRP